MNGIGDSVGGSVGGKTNNGISLFNGYHPMQYDYDAPIKSDKWRNLYFHKSGSTMLGVYIHPKEEIAKRVASDSLSGAKFLKWMAGGVVLSADITHVVQIPWRER